MITTGTRISVHLILEKLRDGWTIEDLLDDCRRLTREQIVAALAYAANVLSAPASFEREDDDDHRGAGRLVIP